MRIARVVMLVVIGALAGEAAACPPGPCNKYRIQTPVEAEVMVYRRATVEIPPRRFDRRSLARFLTASAWTAADLVAPRVGERQMPARVLRFVDAAQVTRTATPDRRVLIRALEQRNGRIYVEIDGVYFALDRCAVEPRRTTSCLVRVGNLPDLVPEDSVTTGQRFATPP